MIECKTRRNHRSRYVNEEIVNEGTPRIPGDIID